MTGPQWAQTNVQLWRNLGRRGWSDSDLAPLRRAYVLAAAEAGGVYRSSGRPLLSHVVGLADVLGALEQQPLLLEVGLLHTAFGQRRYGLVDRRRIRYWRRLLEHEATPGVVDLIDRYDRHGARPPTVVDGRWAEPDLAVLRLANLVEEVDSSVELLSDHHRSKTLAEARNGAEACRTVGDTTLAALVEAAAARAAAVEGPTTPWNAQRPARPVRFSVGWTDGRTHTVFLPEWLRLPRLRRRRAS